MGYSQLFGGMGAQPGMGMGAQGAPSAFTSPSMNPQLLAALLAARGGQGGVGAGAPAGAAPQMPAPPGPSQNAPAGGAIPGAPQPQQQNPAQLLQLLAALKGGATPAGKGGNPALPGSGAGWNPATLGTQYFPGYYGTSAT